MSFSSDAKVETARLSLGDACCMRAEIASVLGISGAIRLLGGGRLGVTLETEHAATARRMLLLLRGRFMVRPALRTTRTQRLGGRNSYRLTLEGPEAEEVLTQCGILSWGEDQRPSIRRAVPRAFTTRACCRKAFLRGAFLAGGSVSNPEKEYHLEFVLSDERFAASLSHVLIKCNLGAKKVHRKGMVVVYLKEDDQIITLLGLIGAHQALMALENVRIAKGIRNNVNRVVNCDSANLAKTVDASSRQVEAIERIRDHYGLDRLSPPLREIAQTRLAHQEVSLAELGELLDPPVGKSGVNHRLRRLISLAEAIKIDEEGNP